MSHELRAELIKDVEPEMLRPRCGRCGHRFFMSPNPSAGWDLKCGGCHIPNGVLATTREWIEANFKAPYDGPEQAPLVGWRK